jgi:hypothetical protein
MWVVGDGDPVNISRGEQNLVFYSIRYGSEKPYIKGWSRMILVRKRS